MNHPYYRNERFGRTITATVDDEDDPRSVAAQVQVTVEDDGSADTIELTRHELRELNRAVGLAERRPPEREVTATVENHLELMDFGDRLRVDTPPAQFRVSSPDHSDGPMWRVTEHDEGHHWILESARTRRRATIQLLERLGVIRETGVPDTGVGEQP